MNLLQRLRRSEPSVESRSSLTFDDLGFLYGGHEYPLGLQTSWGRSDREEPAVGFDQYAMRLLKANPVVFAATTARIAVFSQARLVWLRRRSGRPTDTFTDRRLELFQRPWPGGTASDLLGRMELHNTVAGNAFVRSDGRRLHLMRPDWVHILLGSQFEPDDPQFGEDAVVTGYWYQPGGTGPGRLYMPDEVAHFAPQPDPQATYRGMSWLTPVVREVQGDTAATAHKLKFFENAATPNLLVTFDMSLTKEKVEAFKELMEDGHTGVSNAYKTLYLGGGADATVIGKDLQQLEFSATQGKGETRIAMAAGVHPVVLGASEGLQGSSLNAGNYTAAKRSFSDIHLQHLWTNAVSSLQVLADSPGDGVELWFDKSEIPFLQDDLKDTAEIQQKRAQAIRSLTEAGYEPGSVVSAVMMDDYGLLDHTGVFSVQLQAPGAESDAERQRSIPPPPPPVTPNMTFNWPQQRFDIDVPDVHVQVDGTEVNVPEQRQEPPVVNVQNVVDPTPVTVQNTVEVEPTPVTVENRVENQVDVQPADVTVVEADGEPSRWQVRRDGEGRIVEVFERE